MKYRDNKCVAPWDYIFLLGALYNIIELLINLPLYQAATLSTCTAGIRPLLQIQLIIE